MNKVLITGNKGFIGTHLYSELSKSNHVVGWDLKDGKDILEMSPKDLAGVDYVFHLAAQAKVPLSVADPQFTNRHNITGTLNVLECARAAKVKRVIYSASSSAYGNQDSLPLVETMKPNPMSPYGVQKLVGELYCKVYYELYGLETISLRYFNVFGSGMPTDGPYAACVARFLQLKEQDKPLTVYGGQQKRDMTYVGDVVRANILASKVSLKKHEVVNIGSGRNYSIDEIAKIISKNIEYLPQKNGEPMETLADIKKAKEMLSWEPSVHLTEWLNS